MVIRPSFTIREHAPVATVETLLILSAVACLFLMFLSVATSLCPATRKELPEEKFGEGEPTKRSKHREKERVCEREREKESDSHRIFTTGPLINTH